MKWIIAFMAALPCMDILSRWYLSRDVDYPEGGYLPDNWLCWGTCRAIGGNGPDYRYFLLRLPSYVWMPADYGRSHRWCQRSILMFASKWRMIYCPARNEWQPS